MENIERNLREDLEQLKYLGTLHLGIHATLLQEIAGYWIPKLIELNKALIKVDSWTGQYLVNEAYRPIAEALAKKYRELEHIKVNEILFIDNTTGTGTTLDKRKNAQLGKIPARWQEVLRQLTGRRFYYFMEMFKQNISEMSREQIITLIYHESKHIGLDGDLRHHDIEDWLEVAENLGVDWAAPYKALPDLLDDAVDWDSIQDLGLFPETQLKLVK